MTPDEITQINREVCEALFGKCDWTEVHGGAGHHCSTHGWYSMFRKCSQPDLTLPENLHTLISAALKVGITITPYPDGSTAWEFERENEEDGSYDVTFGKTEGDPDLSIAVLKAVHAALKERK